MPNLMILLKAKKYLKSIGYGDDTKILPILPFFRHFLSVFPPLSRRA
jgi:hypothetical protein